MLMLKMTPANMTNSVIALLRDTAQSSTGSFPDDFVELEKWFRQPQEAEAPRRQCGTGAAIPGRLQRIALKR